MREADKARPPSVVPEDADQPANPGEDPHLSATEGEEINAIGPAGVTANLDIGDIVADQPAGGPHDLGRRAHDEHPPE